MVVSVKVGFLYIKVLMFCGASVNRDVKIVYGVISFCFRCEM
jgi:tetrahydromethanopterin S-methyltransferase subunit G